MALGLAGATKVGPIFGLELMRRISSARAGHWPIAANSIGDIRTADFGKADVVVILDVLHYIAYHDQLVLLRRVRDALPPDGMFARIGNAGGMPFHFSQWVDNAVSFSRGHRLPSLRTVDGDWTKILEQLGFPVDAADVPAHAVRQRDAGCAVGWGSRAAWDMRAC